MYQYKCLNPISDIGLSRFTENYQTTDDITDRKSVV